ncbi:hypothetical protein [Actinomadura parmotrematis]|uniref:XRE family transcriptional regulator n=1 Tax=Actinomadura parmotrematis TaxID=2864039 RepID=A0ABS7FMV8_9ACTN|nr:hypothetical protein [Actinomadura parmotrematis]MBW8481717.1 hypothetical protein [Actinomadura parmotrematis]
MTASEPRPLSEIAGDIGLNMSDVALFSGLDESTVFRLWDNDAWLDRISGRSLQSLISSIPGVAEYSTAHSVLKRRETLVDDLAGEGLVVNAEALDASPVAPQHLLNALEAALLIVRDAPVQKVSSYLARFWGREQDRALSSLFSTEGGLLHDPHRLFESSVDIAPRLNRKSYSFHSILALNILTHQVSKVTGATEAELSFEVPGRRSAFMMRGVVMGSLINSNDVDLAERYQYELERTPIFTALEHWSFPTYTRDGRISSDFTLPSALLLRNTAREVLREIGTYNDAYFLYLLITYVPLALQRDPTFGGRLPELRAALLRRATGHADRRIRRAGAELARRIDQLS